MVLLSVACAALVSLLPAFLVMRFASSSAGKSDVTEASFSPSIGAICEEPPWLQPSFTFISTLQHPPNQACLNARFMVAGETLQWLRLAPLGVLEPDAGDSELRPYEGYAANHAAMSSSLAASISQNRMLMLNLSSWSYGCGPGDPWGCLFAPFSKCSISDGELAARETDVALDALRNKDSDGQWHIADARWAMKHGRYMHKIVIGLLEAAGDEGAVSGTQPPVGLVDASGNRLAVTREDWWAAVRAYLHAHIRPTARRELQTYGGLPPRLTHNKADSPARLGRTTAQSRRRTGADLVIGVHVRVQDMGGGGAGLADTWRQHAELVLRISRVSGASRLLVASDEDDEAAVQGLVDAFASEHGFSARVIPTRVRFPLRTVPVSSDPVAWKPSAATYLRDHPSLRVNATLDILAVVDLLGQCDYIVGRHQSSVVRLAAALARARGCGPTSGAFLDPDAHTRPEAEVAVWSIENEGLRPPGPAVTMAYTIEDGGPPRPLPNSL